MQDYDKLYLIRVFAGAIVGSLCGVLSLNLIYGVGLSLIVYYISHKLSKRVYKGEKSWSIGLGEYLGLWITLWCVTYSVLYWKSSI